MNNMKIKLFLGIAFLSIQFLNAQNTIDVTEQTIKVKALSEEVMYFGFAKGDKIIFNLSEIDGKELKEVEIIEFPSASKFSDFKTSKVTNKVINVNTKCVYKFRFYNSSLGGRICKVKIQRIPSEDKFKGFNTAVKWIKEQDTTWNSYTKDVISGYDTLKVQKKRKIISIEEKIEDMFMDKSQRVHSTTNENGNRTSIFFTLPQNQIGDYESRTVIAWAYWIGVGEESNKAWQQNRKVIVGAVKGFAGTALTPIGAIALGTATNLILPSMGEDVSYGLVDEINKNLFYSGLQYKGFDFGKGVAGYKRFTNDSMLQGTYFVVMSNDNIMQGIDVNVKVSAIIEHKKFKDEVYIEKQVNPKYEKQIIKEPVINTRELPVTFDYKR
jgi:hypothetical protein